MYELLNKGSETTNLKVGSRENGWKDAACNVPNEIKKQCTILNHSVCKSSSKREIGLKKVIFTEVDGTLQEGGGDRKAASGGI